MSKDRLTRPKEVIFFDGDGTLWYPRTTLRTRKPHWVYTDTAITEPIHEMIATPNVASTLTELGRRGILRVLLSTSPLEEREALEHRRAIASHVGIIDLLDDIHVAPERRGGKGEKIAQWLLQHDMSAERALMVGDTYEWDILAANSVGVEGILIDSEHETEAIALHKVTDAIEDLSDIIPLL